MTISEALDKGIKRLRLPVWENPEAYIRLTLCDGGRTVWTSLYSRREQIAIGEPVPQILLHCGDDERDYVEYDGPIDRMDKAP